MKISLKLFISFYLKYIKNKNNTHKNRALDIY
jgi:hypothetical protein